MSNLYNSASSSSEESSEEDYCLDCNRHFFKCHCKSVYRCICTNESCHKDFYGDYSTPQSWPHASDCICEGCRCEALDICTSDDYDPWEDELTDRFPDFCLNCNPDDCYDYLDQEAKHKAEAEAKRKADEEAERKRLADEAEKKRLADEAEALCNRCKISIPRNSYKYKKTYICAACWCNKCEAPHPGNGFKIFCPNCGSF